MGVCDNSGERGYEVDTSFKIRIKSDEDEQEKDELTQQSIQDIIDDNAVCNDYTTSIEEG